MTGLVADMTANVGTDLNAPNTLKSGREWARAQVNWQEKALVISMVQSTCVVFWVRTLLRHGDNISDMCSHTS